MEGPSREEGLQDEEDEEHDERDAVEEVRIIRGERPSNEGTETMTRTQHRTALWLIVAVAWMMSPIATARGDEFNDERLREGQEDYSAKRYAEAIDQFRIAAFGSLDKPVVLSECLVRLSLAQAGAGSASDVSATLDRFLEVERRFQVFAKATLQPETRTAFKTLLLAREPQSTILAVPSLAGLIETEAQKIAKLPPEQRKRALEAAAKREPQNVAWPIAVARLAFEQGDPKEAERWAGKALAIQAGNADALALRGQARSARGQCSDALADFAAMPPEELGQRPELYADRFVCLVQVRNWEEASAIAGRVPAASASRPDVTAARARLSAENSRRAAAVPEKGPASAPKSAPAADVAKSAEAPKPDAARSRAVLADSRRMIMTGKAGDAEIVLEQAVRADPANRDLRLALLEAACLTRSYPTGAAQVPLVRPFSDSEGPSIFYAAVVLYETGKAEEARAYMQQAAGKVTGPLVDEYEKKIVGEAASR
jgi:tetratricopeptide (TPR) repeat protein